MNTTWLPTQIPIFPLSGTILLPGGKLPLHIFEDRYLAMVDYALQNDRMIGLIQPAKSRKDTGFYNVGCIGKITVFEETSDNRYYITLNGINRYSYISDKVHQQGYRFAKVCYESYCNDAAHDTALDIDKDQLKDLLASYFEKNDLSCQMDKIDDAPLCKLLTCLSMICPFDSAEKQALLEANTLQDRADLLLTMLNISNSSALQAHKRH